MKKTFSRIISLLLVVVILAATSPQVFAHNMTNGVFSVKANKKIYYHHYSTSSTDSIGNYEAVKSYIYNAVVAHETTIQLSSFNIDYTLENCYAIYAIVQTEFPEFFHVKTPQIYYRNSYIAHLEITYSMTKSEYDTAIAVVNDRANYILRGLVGSGLSDAEKVLLVHDRLAVYAEYDYANYLNGTLPTESYNMYGTLVKGIAVCQGYAETFAYLMRKLGIESYVLSSSEINHAWNIVTIGGKEYHVDVTWDDIVEDVYGRVFHDNLLRSSEGITATGHVLTEYTGTANDTKYDNYFWRDSITEFQLFKGKIYFINNVNNTLRNLTVGTTTSNAIYTLDAKWSNWYQPLDNGNKVYCFSALSSDDNFLYFTAPTNVLRFNTTNNTAQTVYSPSLPSSDFKIFGFKAYDNKFYLDLNTKPSLESSTRKNYGIVYTYTTTYAVSYNANGATGGTVPGSQQKTDDIALTLATNSGNLVKTGYTIDGWATSPTGAKAYNLGGTYSNNAAVTLYAHWVPNTYTVKFNGNGATGGSMSNQSFTYDVAQNLTANAFQRKYNVTYNYNGATDGNSVTFATATSTFNGWATSAGGSKVYNDKASVKNLATGGTCNLYASWTPGSVTLPSPKKTGISFGGWYTDSSLSTYAGAAGASYTPSGNVTLYAKWTNVTLSSISVETMPTKIEYVIGEPFDQRGLTLRAKYSDNSEKIITSDIDCTGFSSDTEGTKTITVKYQGKETKFDVVVIDNSKKNIVRSVSIDDDTVEYKSSSMIIPKITADKGAVYDVTYTSSNPSVATVEKLGVNNYGLVESVKQFGFSRGSTIITCTVTDSYGNTVSDTCRVTVEFEWWQWMLKIVFFGWLWY